MYTSSRLGAGGGGGGGRGLIGRGGWVGGGDWAGGSEGKVHQERWTCSKDAVLLTQLDA